ncbi:MAG: ABC transporter permease [Pseudomonadota bacterium]
MNDPSQMMRIQTAPPGIVLRVFSIWFRHYRVYTRNLISNGFPPFLEPLFFLAGVGFGLGQYVGVIDGIPYVAFLAAGIIAPPAMFTASFECTYGTFIRLEFDKVYDGMISASLTTRDLFIGEILFCGTKGFFYSGAVLCVIFPFGLIASPMGFLACIGGFLTGVMFASLGLFVTSFVTNINHFNFYFTGLLTPMFFFSGVVFPLTSLPVYLRPVAEIFPLTHSARFIRAFCFNHFDWLTAASFLYMVVFTVGVGYLAIRRLEKRIVT